MRHLVIMGSVKVLITMINNLLLHPACCLYDSIVCRILNRFSLEAVVCLLVANIIDQVTIEMWQSEFVGWV